MTVAADVLHTLRTWHRLDVPLVQHLRTIFLELGARGEMPPEMDDAIARAGALPATWATTQPCQHQSPRFRYEGAAMAQALDALPAQADGSRLLRYVNPVTGGR